MFTHLLEQDDNLFIVGVNNFAKRHFLKNFEKKYKGKMWSLTLDSIIWDLSRLSADDNILQRSQQIDELWHRGTVWIFKYDFAIAKSGMSPKSAGNRIIGVLDSEKRAIEILMVYHKSDLPKNMGEQAFVERTLREEFGEIWGRVK